MNKGIPSDFQTKRGVEPIEPAPARRICPYPNLPRIPRVKAITSRATVSVIPRMIM